MLAIFNTIGQLVGGLCRDHTIAKGLSLKFATSGGLELEAQWAGRQSDGLVTAFALHYSWVYRRKGSVHRIDVGVESAIDNRPPSNIGRACVTTKEAKRKITTASER